jgi:hypothetical protein
MMPCAPLPTRFQSTTQRSSVVFAFVPDPVGLRGRTRWMTSGEP